MRADLLAELYELIESLGEEHLQIVLGFIQHLKG